MNPTIEKYTEELISTWRINSTQFQTDIYRSILINQRFNPMFNAMFNQIFIPLINPLRNPMFNPMFNPKSNQ